MYSTTLEVTSAMLTLMIGLVLAMVIRVTIDWALDHGTYPYDTLLILIVKALCLGLCGMPIGAVAGAILGLTCLKIRMAKDGIHPKTILDCNTLGTISFLSYALEPSSRTLQIV